MKCIVGLGNPGKKYENTRHNMGFLMLDILQNIWDFPEFSASRFSGVISEWILQGEKCILLKPTTFMNLSGQSVQAVCSFYKIPISDILVISDDLDMDFGKIRYRSGGSSGGQNGLRSIAESLGTSEFARLKIGIGRDSRYEVSDWILSKLSPDELSSLEKEILPLVREKIEMWISWITL